VFPDARGLDGATMQRIARELNLSETTFVLPSARVACAARVRIFTPTMEMRFAGHPTIGTSDVLLREGIVPRDAERFTLEELVGDVPIRVERTRPDETGIGEAGNGATAGKQGGTETGGGKPEAEPSGRETGKAGGEHGGSELIAPPMIWLTTPPIEFGRTYDGAACADAFGLGPGDLLGDVPPQLVSAGNPTVFTALRDKAAVDRAWIELSGVRALLGSTARAVCFFVFTPTPEGAYSRMFAPEHGVSEDPATGSATGPLAAYMMRHRLAPATGGTRFVSEQGTKMGRRSFLHVFVHGQDGRDGIEVGGTCVQLAEATLTLPVE
jgi:trans-2,3-dihydro-3-hydroxyanthranilate isomerase